MHGNVLEWVEDSWHEDYRNPPTDGSAWVDENCATRVLRRGSWFNYPVTVRFLYRSWGAPDVPINIIGFRVARTGA